MPKSIFSIFNIKKVIGLYIDQDTVDLVVLKGTFQGPKLVRFGQTSIYPKDQPKDEIMSESGLQESLSKDALGAQKKTKDDFIIEAIKRVFKENNIKPGNVVTAIPSEEVMVRYFQMPKIPKQEWGSAINFEAKRYIPFRMEDVVSDFQVLPSKSSSQSMDVVFVAVKKDVVERFINIINQAGLRPILMEPVPFSLMRALNAAGQINTKINTAIVDINSTMVSIDILRSGVPYIIRDIPLAESIPGEKSLEPIFEKLLAEIKLSFDFYEKQFPTEIIDKIIIYSKMPFGNWHELVGKELQIPVEVGDPLRGIRIRKDVIPARSAVCFGLALRGLSEPFIEVNLCKEKLILYKKKEFFLKLVFMEASVAVFLLIILKVLSIRALRPLTNELNKTLSERPKIEVSIKTDSLHDMERIKNEMEKRKYILENMMSNRTYATARLKELSSIVPENMWLSEVIYEEKIGKKNISAVSRSLRIKGYCIIEGKVSETDIVNNFLSKLKESDGINKGMAKAEIVSVKKTDIKEKHVASFEILFTGQ